MRERKKVREREIDKYTERGERERERGGKEGRERETELERLTEREAEGELMTKQNEMSTIFGCSEGCCSLLIAIFYVTLCHNLTVSRFQDIL